MKYFQDLQLHYINNDQLWVPVSQLSISRRQSQSGGSNDANDDYYDLDGEDLYS